MKTPRLLLAIAAGVVLAALFAPQDSTGQTAAPDAQTAALIQEIRAQQKTLTENQAAIDQKIADLAEQLRMAKIFVSRTGKGSKR
jgi:aspartokinase-like uncharacterized kinase